MKHLFIEDKLVIIDQQSTKFPFSHKINDLEEFNIIGLPGSKTIDIPRNETNDSIFGFIGEIHRLTFNLDNDEKVGISFNQTKKCSYTLLDDSEVVSSGKLIVTNITNDIYQVELYDELVHLLEQFEGNTEDGSGFLNDLDIYYDGTDNKIEYSCLSYNLPYYAQQFKNLKYSVNLNDDDLTDTSFRCIDSTTSKPNTFELREEMSQVQSRTIKTYDIDYNAPINGIIYSINKKYNNIIEIDSKLSTYFNELHLNCGKAKKYDKISTEWNLKPYSDITTTWVDNGNVKHYAFLTYPAGYTEYGRVTTENKNYNKFIVPLKDLSSNYVTNKNGKYYIELPLQVKLFPSSYYTGTSTAISHFNGKNFYYNNINEGEKFGQMYFKTTITNYSPGTVPAYNVTPNFGSKNEYSVNVIENELNFIKGISANVTLNTTTNKYEITCTQKLIIEFDYYPLLGSTSGLGIELNIEFPQKSHSLFYVEKVGTSYNHIGYDIKIDLLSGGRVIHTPNNKLHTGEIINGKNIYPKVSIKNFLIELVKYHNLKIVNNNGKLRIEKKLYYNTNELLNITKINGVNTKLFDYSKMVLSYDLPDNDLVNSTYEEINKQKYGQKTINLNYSIKNSTKSIEYGTSIPSLIRDTKKYAYDEFGGYYNAGRNRSNLGCTQGFNDKVVFCFLNEIRDNMVYLTNDTFYEAGMGSSFETNIPTEIKFLKTNLNVLNTGGIYTFPGNAIYGISQGTGVPIYYTSSPYKFDPDGKVTKSLEINKPKYNYANLTDTTYVDSSTHYDRYLKKTIEDRYSVNTHILDCDIYFNEKPDVNKIFNYQNVNYIISELPEYDPTGGLSTGVKLLKVNNVNNYLFPYGLEEGVLHIASFSNVTKTTMNVNSIIDYTGGDTIVTAGVKWGLSTNSLVNTSQISNPSNSSFTNSIYGLTKNVLYYFQPYMISVNGIYSYGDVLSQRTLDDYSTPTVNIITVSNTTYTTTVGVGNTTSAGGYPITEYGFVYGTSQFPTLSNSKKIVGTINYIGGYNGTISSLTANTTYYVRAYAINQNGAGYSPNQITFTTIAYVIPTLTTLTPHSILQKSGYSGGYNLNNNGQVITDKGVVIGFLGDPNPTISTYEVKVSNGFGGGDFTSYFDNLPTVNEAYNIRAYATNSVGTGYGQTLQFTTLPIQIPEIMTESYVVNLSVNGCGFLSTMVYDGGYDGNVEEYGVIVHPTNPNLVINTPGVIECWGDTVNYGTLTNGESFEVAVDGLSQMTTYYYRAFAYNSAGIGYSDVYQFRTLSNYPTITNQSLTRLNDYDSDVYLRFDITGTYEVLEYGVIFSTSNSDPTFGDSEFVKFNGDPLSVVNATFTNSEFGNYQIGYFYCKMFILTSFGYIYSYVVSDTYGGL